MSEPRPKSPPGIRRPTTGHRDAWEFWYIDEHGRRQWERMRARRVEEVVAAREQRKADVRAGRFGYRRQRQRVTFAEFVFGRYLPDVAGLEVSKIDAAIAALKARPDWTGALERSTLEGYLKALRNVLLPRFGTWPLSAITRPAVRRFVLRFARQVRRLSHSKDPDPDGRPVTAKYVRNIMAVLSAILEAAVEEELLDQNPVRGALSRRKLPKGLQRIGRRRPPILEPDEFVRAIAKTDPRIVDAAVVAACTGVRWEELVALRVGDVDFRRHALVIDEAFYGRVAKLPKSDQGDRDIELWPTARAILARLRVVRAAQMLGWDDTRLDDEAEAGAAAPLAALETAGLVALGDRLAELAGPELHRRLVFSPDGVGRIGHGSWIKRTWREAQRDARVRTPISWRDLRHEFASLLIAAGRSALYVAQQLGHTDPGFTLRQYAHLFERRTTHVEWPDDLLWPAGYPHTIPTAPSVPARGKSGRSKARRAAKRQAPEATRTET